jgi:hypothetical protein
VIAAFQAMAAIGVPPLADAKLQKIARGDFAPEFPLGTGDK